MTAPELNPPAGYYDDGPLVTLERHLALVGLVAADTRRIGYRLAAYYGLPCRDVDRTVEHLGGGSLWAQVMTEGVERYRELERRALAQALAEKPYGILTLGDATLLDDSNLRAVKGGAVLVALERDLANCYWRFQALKDELPESAWHPFFAEPLRSIEQVRPFYRERHGALASAHHTVELLGRPLGEVVEVLAGLLPIPAPSPFEGEGGG